MSQVLLFGLFASWFAFHNGSVPTFIGSHPPFPYHLDHPDAAFDMPNELKEISGISLAGGGQMLAAVNDEKGIIFLLDKSNGTIKSRIVFREEGDYEGIEIVGNDAWVSKSNGTLYQVKNFASPNPEVQSFKSFLNKENDVEGLAFDAKNNHLLLGCKGKGASGDGAAFKKAIYAFDLATKTVSETPAYLLTLPDLEDFLKTSGESDAEKKMEHIASPEETEMKFSPSGIAVHPKTGEIYVTSARGNTLLVLNSKGKILHLERLKKSVHGQPEGICFDSDGTLFIANEGADGSPGKIFVFYAK